MLKNLFVVLSLFVFVGTAEARHHSRKPASKGGGGGNPKEMVAKYLDADFRGSRVSGDNNAATKTLVNWDSEPQDDRIIIVQSYSVGSTKIRRRVAKVPVKFINLGELKGSVYYPDRTTEEATFEIVRHKGPARIDRPILMPHVSATFAQSYLTSKLAKLSPDSDEAVAIQKSLEAIRTQVNTTVKQKE